LRREVNGQLIADGTNVPGRRPARDQALTGTAVEGAHAQRSRLVAATTTRTVKPASAGATVYVEVVAFGIATHPSPVVSGQRSHWYEKTGVSGACHVPAEALSTCPVSGTPVTVGGVIDSGGGAITADAIPLPRKRSPSTQPRIPRTRLQSVHCQNDQP